MQTFGNTVLAGGGEGAVLDAGKCKNVGWPT
jgi:hypothetical protein